MKKYLKEIIILLIQMFMFYIFPLFAGPTDMMGMVFLIIVSVFITSILISIISNQKIRFFYSIIITILFIPTVIIYYNESALVHALWYLIISTIGFVLGTIIKKITFRK